MKNTGESKNYWPENDKFPKLKKFEIDNGRITDNYEYNNIMPELEKFIIKSRILETLPKKLKQLYHIINLLSLGLHRKNKDLKKSQK